MVRHTCGTFARAESLRNAQPWRCTKNERVSDRAGHALARMARPWYGHTMPDPKRVILRLSDGSRALLRLEPARIDRLVARDAEVWVEEPLPDGWIAAFRILPAPDGSPMIGEARVFPGHPRRGAGRWAPETDLAGDPRQYIPRGGLTSRLLRKVKVPGAVLFTHRLMREYAEGWAHLGVDAQRELFEPYGLESEPRPRSGPGRPPLSDLEMARAVGAYVDALERGSRTPVPDVAAELGVSVDTARAHLGKARKRKPPFLTPPPPGRAGGRMTPECEAVLAEDRRSKRRRKKR